jgi:sec-independent protein translocase protein TatC
MATATDTIKDETELEEESSMSFLDHLDELRTRLIRSVIFVLVTFILSWTVSERLYQFLEVPVRAAMLEARKQAPIEQPDAQLARLEDLADTTLCTFGIVADTSLAGQLVPAGTTLSARVQRAADGFPDLIVTVAAVLPTRAVIPEGFVIPRELISPDAQMQSPDNRLVVGTVQGAFNLYIKVAFYAAIFFSVPFLLVQAWGFISPGLYAHEKKYAFPFIAMASFFFLAGISFAYYIAFPRAASFLLDVAAAGKLRPLVSAEEYFDLILTIMLGLGLVFEIPTVTFFLARLGLVTPHILLKFWRVAFILILIVAALLSPTTDVPNLLVFAVPMMVLYLLSVGIAWVFYRKRMKQQEREASEST